MHFEGSFERDEALKGDAASDVSDESKREDVT